MSEPRGPDAGSSVADVETIVDELSTDAKIDLLYGSRDPAGRATGYVAANDRVGTPSMSLVDGPLGVRTGRATAFPASIALAASWDTDLAREFGTALAGEVRAADQDGVLAPGVNLVRDPRCGRAFEYYGEDPYLNSRLAVGTIEGIQSAGVLATVKHYVANNQETDRHQVSADVGERALREIYLPPFEAAVTEAEVGAVMAAYNRVNGAYATENRRLLTDVLKDEWGFDGFVVSDWWATRDGEAAARAGLDLDMPGMPVYEWSGLDGTLLALFDAIPDTAWFPKRRVIRRAIQPWQPANPNPKVLDPSPFDEDLREAVASGRIDEERLDEKLERLFRQMVRFGLFDADRPAGARDTAEHRELARRIAERGAVLLVNEDGTLPLDGTTDVTVIGPHADEAKVGGGGSSEVDPTRTISPFAGVRERAAPEATVSLEPGLPPVGDASMFDSLRPDVSDYWQPDPPRIEDAMTAAREAGTAVVVVRDLASEGEDRDLSLPGAQNELIEAVAAAADRTVVVLNTAGMVRMPWLDDVDAVLETWYPGQEAGRALAALLYGDADPSGRLPVTVGERPGDYPATTPEQYPGVDGTAEYTEGVFVGYRHFDAAAIEPLFEFGHGLSYTEFAYRDLSIAVESGEGETDRVATATVAVENVGERDGRDVVQAYLHDVDPSVERPSKELAAFEPVALSAGEETRVTLEIDRRNVAYYDDGAGDWTVDGGEYELLVGRSSRDVRVRESFELSDLDP